MNVRSTVLPRKSTWMLPLEGGGVIGFGVPHPEDMLLAAAVVLKKNRPSDTAAVVSAKTGP